MSDVLAGRRELSRDHIEGLAAFFPAQLRQPAITPRSESPVASQRKGRPGEQAVTPR